MLCYKYMPWDYWFDSVLMGRLKLSVPSEFNDPFDCDGDVVGSYRQSVIDDWVDKNFEPSEELPTREMFKSAFLLTYQEHMRSCLLERKYFDQLCRILCLVNAEQKIPSGDDLLLWSHYTGNAKGVRILIDIPRKGMPYELEDVEYEEHKPVSELSMASEVFCSDPDFYHDRFYTKGTPWAYEHEVRLVMHKPFLDNDYHIKVGGIDYFKFPVSWIKEVAFGVCVDQERVQCYVAMLRKHGLTRIRYFKTAKQVKKYGLQYVLIP